MTAPNTHYQSASLYVGDLHPAVTEAILFDLFKSVGPVASIRVCRDAVTRRSLGYAYVNFHNTLDAERALDTLNYAPIRGKPCRIMWSHRDPSVRKSGQGNVFIKNLDKSIDNKALYDTFSTFGNILSCKVVTDTKGNSKGYGFVHYETQEAADQAINKVHGMLLANKIVFVGPFIPNKERCPGTDPDKFTNLYVKHLAPDVTEAQLKAEFEQFGPTQSAVIMRSSETGESKRFGFVNFVNHEDAMKAVESMNGKLKLGKSDKDIYVTRAQKKSEREMVLKKLREERAQKYQGINLYVKYLDDSIDDVKLREHFADFGTITSCKVMRDEKGNSKGFGFVCFTTPDEASKAVTQLHNTLLAGKPIYVALAERKDMRRSKLEAQYAARRMAGNPGLNNAPVYPVFYSQAPQQARQPGYVPGYPGGMVRPRWPTPAGGQARQGGYPGVQGFVGVAPHPGGAPRGQRQNRSQQRTGGQGQIQGLNRFKYTPNARNQQPGQNLGGKVEGGHGLVSSATLTSGALASASPEERKQILGESLFPRIRAVEPTQAGKITGMLLESLESHELLHLLDSPEALQEKVEEARTVLKEHQSRQGDVIPALGENDEADG
jgi:polyadenylate-binding protein